MVQQKLQILQLIVLVEEFILMVVFAVMAAEAAGMVVEVQEEAEPEVALAIHILL